MRANDVNNSLRDSATQFAQLYLDSSQKIGEVILICTSDRPCGPRKLH